MSIAVETFVTGAGWLSHLPDYAVLLAPSCLAIGLATSFIPLPSYLKDEGELQRVPAYLRRPIGQVRRWTILSASLLETVAWAAACGWSASVESSSEAWWISLIGSAGHAIVWSYIAYKLPSNSVAPTPYLWLAPLLILRPALVLLEAAHTAYAYQASILQFLPPDRLAPTLLDLFAAILVFSLTLGMRVDEREVTVEDELENESGAIVTPETVDEKIQAYWKEKGFGGPSVETDSTVWRSWTYNWILPLLRYGYDNKLTVEDIPALPRTLRSQTVYEMWTKLNAEGKKRSLTQKVIRANARDIAIMILAAWAEVGAMYVGPFCVKRILDGLTKATPDAMADAYLYTFIALVGAVAKAAFESIGGWHGRRAGCAVRAEIIANVYEKALKRSDFSGAATKDADKQKDGEHTTGADLGKIVQIMSNDSRKLAARVMNTDIAVAAPIQLVIAIVFLYNLMGWSAFAGFIAVIIALPLNSYLANRSVVITKAVLAVRDRRMKTMNELILAIKHIKFFAWEKQWNKRVLDIFEEEMVEMRRNRINSVMFGLVWYFAPLGMNLASFACYIYVAKKELDVATAFTAIALFNMLKMPLTAIPAQRVAFMQAYVSVKRIEAFLEEPECEAFVSTLKRDFSEEPAVDLGSQRLGIENGSFVWVGSERPADITTGVDVTITSDAGSNSGAQTGPFVLADVDVDFPIGKLTLITGPTGSGKTALLNALLGEMDCIAGKVHLVKRAGKRDADGLENTVAFAAQTPWLQYMTIRNNILFGSEYERERYDQVIDSCCLGPDVAMFEDGDNTEIGIKGVTLSGGQKARVALARAVYSRARHLILDDVFAAVDVHVAKRLVEKCLKGPLLQGRTVVLVSHHAELLLKAGTVHHLVDMSHGRIRCSGTIEELRRSGDLPEILAEEEEELEKEVNDDDTVSSSQDDSTKVATPTSEDKPVTKHLFGKLVKEEERQFGSVQWSTYKLYLAAASWTVVASVLVVQLLGELCSASSRFWLKIWGEAYPDKRQAFESLLQRHFVAFDMNQVHLHGWVPKAGDVVRGKWPSALEHPSFYLGVFALISIVQVGVFTTAQQALMFTGTLRASRTLHFKLLQSVTRATFRWYDTNPAGRILNRFSSDLELITSGIGSTLRSVIVYMASLCTAVIMMSLVVSPWVTLMAMAVSLIYWRVGIYYVRTARECRRLLASSRSPLYTAFGEALDGIVTVRAFSAEKGLLNGMYKDVDFMHSQTYIWQMCNKWLLFNFDVLGAIITFGITLMALQGNSAGSAGIAIVSVQSFVGCLFYISRDWTNVEQAFNSVERVEEYLEIPHEPKAIEEHRRPPAAWPSNHCDLILKVEDLSVRYDPELPDVLKGISFEVKPRERVGIVGRTGSGKSTLGMSLLRFCDPSGGRIVLDGIDTTTVGVEDLRSRMTYIPQEACLFSGTIRSNLDPFSEHTDEELNDALIRAQLTSTSSAAPSRSHSRQVSRAPSFASLEAPNAPPAPDEHDSLAPVVQSDGVDSPKPTAVSLDSHVSAGGANWSHGQRQLISLARAIVRQSACVIMDEATSAVDTNTDAALQTAIAENFKNSCLITVAHRLNTIIGFDRVLVLDSGRVIEFDSPHNLLQRPTSAFRAMVAASGQEEELTKAAAEAAGQSSRGPDNSLVDRVKRLG